MVIPSGLKRDGTQHRSATPVRPQLPMVLSHLVRNACGVPKGTPPGNAQSQPLVAKVKVPNIPNVLPNTPWSHLTSCKWLVSDLVGWVWMPLCFRYKKFTPLRPPPPRDWMKTIATNNNSTCHTHEIVNHGSKVTIIYCCYNGIKTDLAKLAKFGQSQLIPLGTIASSPCR